MQDSTNDKQLAVFEHLSKGNKFVFYIYRRISRISGAVYLITDLIKDAEPLKWQLRKTASEMMSLRNFFDQTAVFNTLEEYLLILEGELEFGKSSRIVSEMNTLVIQSELSKLLSEIRERSKEGFYAPELIPSFFDIEKPASIVLNDLFPKAEPQSTEQYKGHKGQSVRYDLSNHKPQPKPAPRSHATSASDNGSKGHRRDEILRIIKAKGSVTIKDITDLIHDCSEKTVQRELLGLVDSGVVKKTGERRWSRYVAA